MHPIINANAPAIDRGECDKLKGNASRSETALDYKRGFLRLKANTFLSHGLDPKTPEAIALANGAQLILLLRSAGITEAQLEFSIRREAAP